MFTTLPNITLEIKLKKSLVWRCENRFYPEQSVWAGKTPVIYGQVSGFPAIHTHTRTHSFHLKCTINEPGNQKPAECMKPTRISLLQQATKPVVSPAWGPVRAAASATVLLHGNCSVPWQFFSMWIRTNPKTTNIKTISTKAKVQVP